MSTLEIAIALAATNHAGQLDKAGMPYILHPLAVMQLMKTLDEMIVAVLHDIFEDTSVTQDDLLELGFSVIVIDAIHALTKHKGESRLDAAKRTSLNPLATRVKLADVTHNMDLSRLAVVTEKDLKRQAEYEIVKDILKKALGCQP